MESLDRDGVSVTTEQNVNTYHVTVRRYPEWVDIVYSVQAADIEVRHIELVGGGN